MENKTPRETRLAALLCPSTPDPGRVYSLTVGGFGVVASAVSDYGVDNAINTALYSMGLIDAASYNSPVGVMRVNELQRFADITDGLSNTSWIVEDAGRPFLYRGQEEGFRIHGERLGLGQSRQRVHHARLHV